MLNFIRLAANEHQFLAEKQIFIENFIQISDSMNIAYVPQVLVAFVALVPENGIGKIS